MDFQWVIVNKAILSFAVNSCISFNVSCFYGGLIISLPLDLKPHNSFCWHSFFPLGTSDAKTELQQLIVGTESVEKENGKRLKLDHCQAGQGVKPLEAGLQRSQSTSQISRGNDDLFCASFGFSMGY